ncbi:MAG: PQQ-binding-like beta-propeller repeat protein [Planctomycetota bacterium]
MTRRTLVLALAVLATGTLLTAEPSVGWRGDGTGRYPQATPPTEWSAEKNVVWKTPTPAWSNASPVIVGDRIFICAEPSTLLCLNKADGKILWQKACGYDVLSGAEGKEPVGKEVAPPPTPPSAHEVNGYSSATPVSDGKSVYVVFGTGIAACYDLAGNRRWVRMVERPSHNWGHSTSPVLVDDKLIVHVKKVWALKTSDGATAWSQDSAQAWGTPAVARVGGKSVGVMPAGDFIRADDGVTIASKAGSLTYASPIVHDGMVYFAQDNACGVRLPETAEPAAQLKPAWSAGGRKGRFYASSVFHAGLLYVVNQSGEFNVLDAATGDTLAGRKLELGGTTYPSIALAGERLFVSSDTGKTIVLELGKELKQVAANTLEPFRSTPVFEGARMYVRTTNHLICIGQ